MAVSTGSPERVQVSVQYVVSGAHISTKTLRCCHLDPFSVGHLALGFTVFGPVRPCIAQLSAKGLGSGFLVYVGSIDLYSTYPGLKGVPSRVSLRAPAGFYEGLLGVH